MSILRKNAAASAETVATTPAFESEADTAANVTETTEGVAKDTAAEVKETAAEVKTESTSTAVAEQPAASAPAVAQPGKPLTHVLQKGNNVSPLMDLKDAFQGVGIDVEYNTFPRYRDDKGVIGDPDGNEAGSYLEVQVLSWNHQWVVTPADDSDKAKEHLRYSKDGKTLDSDDEWGGKPCDEYRDHLVELGYEKAGIKKYTYVFGMMVDAEQPDCPGMQQIIQLSLAPTSGALWDAYMLTRTVRARMGKVQETSGNPVIRFTSKRAKSGNNVFFKLEPSDGLTPPAEM